MNAHLIQLGNFKLHSGATSDWKLVCDHFIAENAAGLCHLIFTLPECLWIE